MASSTGENMNMYMNLYHSMHPLVKSRTPTYLPTYLPASQAWRSAMGTAGGSRPCASCPGSDVGCRSMSTAITSGGVAGRGSFHGRSNTQGGVSDSYLQDEAHGLLEVERVEVDGAGRARVEQPSGGGLVDGMGAINRWMDGPAHNQLQLHHRPPPNIKKRTKKAHRQSLVM